MRRHPWDLCALALIFFSMPAAAQWQRFSDGVADARAHAIGAPDDAQVLQIAKAVHTEPGEIPRLVAVDAGRRAPLPLQHTAVFAEVTGPVARVSVIQTYENPHQNPIEAIYVFPLPENAAVDAMKLTVGDRVIEATIRERGQARRVYEAARRQGHTAALLEQERPNIFTQSVANIAPGETISVEVRYVQMLGYDAGEYEFVFPMVVGPRFIPGQAIGKAGSGWSPDTTDVPDASRITPRILGAGTRSGHDIDIEVSVDAGLPLTDLQVPTHLTSAEEHDGVMQVRLAKSDRLPNRDFVMRWTVAGEAPRATVLTHRDPGGKGLRAGGFVTLVVQPPKADVDALVGRRELIFVVDVSGSMSGAPLAQAKAALHQLTNTLRPTDTFNVVTFAGRTGTLWATPRPANQANLYVANQFIAGQRAGGGTMMAGAVQAALSPQVEKGRDRYVVFLTDGYIGNEKQIFAGAEALVAAQIEAGRKARVFALGVGSSVNRHLIDGLGKAGDGLGLVLTLREDPARAVNQIKRIIDHPILEEVRIDWGGLTVEDIQPRFIPDVFATRPLVLHGRYRRGGTGEVTVRGVLAGEPVTLKVDVELPRVATGRAALASLWARTKIGELERDRWQVQDPTARAEITKLGLEFGLVTAFTSFVAVDRSRVVRGHSTTIVQPTAAPEGVNLPMAAPAAAVAPPPARARRPRSRTARPMPRPVRASAAPRRAAPAEVDDLLGSLDGARSGKKPLEAAQPTRPAKLTRRQILTVIKAATADLRMCPDVAPLGTAVVGLTIEPDGRVSHVNLSRLKLKLTPAQTRCITQKLKAMRFPRFAGQAMRINMPMLFGGGG